MSELMLAEKRVTCGHCGKRVRQAVGAINRAKKLGAPLYCDRRCAGLARRVFRTPEQKVAEKRLYDIEYRRKNRRRLKAEKRAYFQRTYDPAKAAERRRERMPLHVEYCRQPRYRRWKRRYDQNYRAQKVFGPYAESFLMLQKLEKEVASRMSRYDIALANGTLNKWLNRRREYERLVRG